VIFSQGGGGGTTTLWPCMIDAIYGLFWETIDFKPGFLFFPSPGILAFKHNIYRVSHNTWDYKNALGRPLNDNIQSCKGLHVRLIFEIVGLEG
jgi:hypothetical protein